MEEVEEESPLKVGDRIIFKSFLSDVKALLLVWVLVAFLLVILWYSLSS